ncbi:head-tail adaptor [Photorhabdus hindustanensis]|uniref:Head-tail adaptor n=1 Tax=Photorhabdus hindustanensis TaxID=2918802 RepID=A0A2S8PZS3_9GAMM|nr:head-tail adaptor [Photorhabdus hindustanensis]PQQ24789.1 head-tail adaptor [Photorhabdus hindustanensis]
MPFLDVTEVLFDPDFCDTTLKYTRRKVIVDDDGFATSEKTTKGFAGVVTVDSSLEAQMRIAGQVVSGNILIITTERLISGETDKTGDVVTYQNRDYLVKSVDPYTAYGAGFVQAHCELLPFDGGTPVE